MNWDKLLGILATPDWITPAIGIAQAAAHSGDRCGIRYSRNGLSVKDAERRLKQAGIKYWNSFIVDGDGYLEVSQADAERARRLVE